MNLYNIFEIGLLLTWKQPTVVVALWEESFLANLVKIKLLL